VLWASRAVPEGYFWYARVCGASIDALGQFKAIKMDFESVIGLRGVPESYFGYACVCGASVAALGQIKP